MSLGMADYDEMERRAKSALSFQEIRAFASTAMVVTGFPARIESESQIASYMDWNDGNGPDVIFARDFFYPVRALRTVFTAEEAALARAVADAVARLTKGLIGREMRPIGTLIDMFGMFRIIQAMKAAWGLPQISVFEAGPGNGYLGALLAMSGDRYVATDNSQAFYLWHNRLLEACASDDFWDWAEKGPPPSAAPRVQHLPWWDFVRLRHHQPLHVDIFVSNCNLGEMNPYALKYTTRISRSLLSASPMGRFLYVTVGNPIHATPEGIERELQRSGFRRIYGKLFHCFALHADARRKEPNFDAAIPLYGSGATTDARGLLAAMGVNRDNLPFDIDFLSFLGFENHFVDHPAFKGLIGSR
jgi:hypothetical protein